MRPAHGVAVGVVFACALGIVARYIATPLPLASPAASIPAHASSSGVPLSDREGKCIADW